MKKRALSFIMACMMIVSTFIISRPIVRINAAESESGVSFATSETYIAKNNITTTLQTVEAYVYLPSAYTARAGIIVSNYAGANDPGFALEIHEKGVPRLFWQQSNWADAVDLKFTDVSVAKDEWLHIAVTRDLATKTARCYINGELKQTLTWSDSYVDAAGKNYCVGGDYRSGNSQNFKGKIQSVAAYSDVRSAAEIASDVSGLDYTDSALLFAYDLTASGTERLKDSSANGNHLIYTNGTTTETYADSYISFTSSTIYQTTSALSSVPLTMEATVYIPSSANGKRGCILGNYLDGNNTCVTMEITAAGALRTYYISKINDAVGSGSVVFSNINLFVDNLELWTHVTIVRDPSANKAHCYIDGVLKDTVDLPRAIETGYAINNGTMCIGNDFRSGTKYPFLGYIKNAAMYSDVRSADEIKADIKEVDTSDSALIVSYDFSNGGNVRLKDHSKNGNHLIYTNGSTTEEYVEPITLEGMSFVQNTLYTSQAPLSAVPLTVEAYVNVPAAVASQRIGVIYGNYQVSGVACVSFEVLQNGVPRFYWQNGNGTSSGNCSFSGINIADGTWKHVTVVRDPNAGKAYCYINGVLAGTASITANTIETSYTNPICIGGDLRRSDQNDNSCRFLGKINSITAYSDVRTATEIANDYAATAPDYSDSALIAHYDLTSTTEIDSRDVFVDLSGNGNDVYSPWINDQEVDDYSYTFVVVGDTQKVIQNDVKNGTNDIAALYDYIVNNVEKQNIKLVMGLGDITETYSGAANEWTLAKNNIFKLNGKVPYILNRGNHDDSNALNNYFNNTAYSEQLEGTYDGKIENSYFTLTVGQIKYLVMALDYGASDDVLTWAAGIIDAHPEYNVIITTHAYMYRDGTTLDDGDVCPPSNEGGNDGDDIWEKFVKNHENIVLVLSGHDPWDKIVMREDDGVNGNKVVQMLIDPQGMDNVGNVGMVAIFHFSEDGKTVQVEYYSTVEEKWYHPDNQFTFTLDVVMPCEHENALEATCKEASVCPDCGVTVAPINPENHVGEANVYVDNGNGTHTVKYSCCDAEKETVDCEYGDDYVCDKCEYDNTLNVLAENANSMITDYFTNGEIIGEYIAAVGPAAGALDNYATVQNGTADGFTYAQFNLVFIDGKAVLRNHFIITGDVTVTLNGAAVELKNDDCPANVFYFDVELDVGEFDDAQVIVAGDAEITVSLYSYIKVALEKGVSGDQETILRALYDLNEAAN